VRHGVSMTPNASASTAAVWDRFRAGLWAFFRARVRDEATADDLLQDTFLRVHRRPPELAGDEGRLGAWLFGVARNVVADHYRSNGPSHAHMPENVPTAEPDETGGAATEARGWLAGFVSGLPETYREAVRLSELEGRPHAEVADRLGLSLTAVKSRVRRGRALVKRDLEDCCRFEVDRRGNVMSYERKRDTCGCGDGPTC
jgi:RNA polymerase sigma-70 factor (ECF subfamily)